MRWNRSECGVTSITERGEAKHEGRLAKTGVKASKCWS